MTKSGWSVDFFEKLSFPFFQKLFCELKNISWQKNKKNSTTPRNVEERIGHIRGRRKRKLRRE